MLSHREKRLNDKVLAKQQSCSARLGITTCSRAEQELRAPFLLPRSPDSVTLASSEHTVFRPEEKEIWVVAQANV